MMRNSEKKHSPSRNMEPPNYQPLKHLIIAMKIHLKEMISRIGNYVFVSRFCECCPEKNERRSVAIKDSTLLIVEVIRN